MIQKICQSRLFWLFLLFQVEKALFLDDISNFKRTKNIVLSMSMSTTWLQKISSLLYKQKTAKHFWLTLTACYCQSFFRFRLPDTLFSNFLLEIFCFLWPSFYYSFLCVFESGFCLHKARIEVLKREEVTRL